MIIRVSVFGIFLLFTLSVIAQPSLEEAYKSYLLGDWGNSLFEGLEIEKTSPSPQIFYLLGMNYLKLEDFPRARDYFRKVIKNFPQSKLYESSFIKLGDAYFLEEDFNKATLTYEYVLKNFPSTQFKPLIYLRLAQSYAKQGLWGKERVYIDKIKKEYPESVEKKYAEILEKRGFFFTIQVGAFSHKKNALRVVKRLKKRYPVYLVKERFGDLLLYKVRVGKFKERKRAEDIASSLIDKGYPARIYP